MLPFFRAKKKWLNWTLWIVILALAFTTVLLFVDAPRGLMSGLGAQEVALVAGQPISAAEYRRQYRQLYDFYRQMYQLDQQDPAVVKQLGLGQQALNQLINDYAISHEARQLGLGVTSEEVMERIQRFPVFRENNRFIGVTRYRQILEANNLTPAEFESGIRREILREKLRRLVTDGILATPAEILQQFLEQNQEVKVRYVYFRPEDVEQAPVEDSQLQQYYQENQDQYRVSEQRKIKYVVVAPRPDQVEVNDQQVEAEIPNVPEGEQVRARHILVRSMDEATEAAARRKAQEILRQIRSGADFAEMARLHSDDTSASQGGDLGFFGRGEMVTEFEEVAFSLPPGQVSEVVKTPFGFHIIQVLEKSGPDGSNRRTVAEYLARQKEASRRAEQQAGEIAAAIRSGTPPEEAARSHGLEVRESPFLNQGDPIPGFMTRSEFNQRLFGLPQGGVTDPYESNGQYIVAQVIEVKPERIPDFQEIQERVAEDFRNERKDQIVRAKAAEFYKQARSQGSLEAVAQAQGLRISETGFFKKGATIDDVLKFSPEVHDRAFRLKEGEISPPVQVAGNYVVFQVAEKSRVDMEQFEKEKKEIAGRLEEQKRSQFFASYVQNVVDQLRRNNRIEVNQPLLDQIAG